MKRAVLLLLLSGCASAPPMLHARRAVQLVARAPRGDTFVLVGRVRGQSSDGDFVAAAKQARESLLAQAESLGADIVRIDRVTPEAPGALIAGRAYKLAY